MVMRVTVFMVVAMAVLMASVIAIGTVFGFKRLVDLGHLQVHGTQHVGQHMIGFDFQMVGLQLDRHMAVAQVVGSTGQVKGSAVVGIKRDAQHRLRCCQDVQQRAVFTDQHIATPDRGAARQKHTHAATAAVGGFKAAFLPHIPIQLDGVGAFEQRLGQAQALAHEFGEMDHASSLAVFDGPVRCQNKK